MERFGWWEVLAFTHRWLGIAGCLLILLWFTSGIAMMYVGMPEVTAEEHFSHLAPLDLSSVNVSLVKAASAAGAPLAVAQLTMLGGRPVYRFGGRTPATVFGDSGERLDDVSPTAALTLARDYASSSTPVRALGALTQADQWTLQLRQHFPLHHFAVEDDAGTEIYVSSRTGEVVMDSTASERRLAYIGPVAHWLYLPVLRRNGPLWTQVIIWSSIAGCTLCVLGLIAGLVRLSPRRRFSLRGGPSMSPYSGWMKWHHYAGLIFGVVTFTWTFSGLLSMGPFALLSSGGASAEQRRAVTGTITGLEALGVDTIKQAATSAGTALTAKELALLQFRGRLYWLASESPARHVLIDATHPQQRPFARFDDESMAAAARDAGPTSRIIDATWLDVYDDYYYDRRDARPLPVLRVRYDDPQRTWMYLEPSRGAIALVVRTPDRINRWLYHGLHSLDMAWIYSARPAWDLVVIALSLGGIAGVATSLVPAWRRLSRHMRRWLERAGAGE